MKDLSALARQTQSVYERNAARFDNERPKNLYEKQWLDRFLGLIPDHGNILDLGCGTGDPIAAYFIENDYKVTGLDASHNMIDIAKRKFQNGDWRVADMRNFELAEQFNGIIAWHSFFHLTRDEQRKTLPIMARHLRPNGALLLTVGASDGEVSGHVGDDPIYHSSLSPDEYERILQANDIQIRQFEPEDPECGGSTLLLAQKNG